jgi:hypothetical protein
MKHSLSLCLLLLTSAAFAQEGYVVKTTADGLYLDLGKASGAKSGDRFTVYKEGENLKHPVTGENLGAEETTLAGGTIVEVREKYSIGKLDASSRKTTLAPAMKVRLKPTPKQAPVAASTNRAAVGLAPDGAMIRKPIYQSPPLELEAVDIAVGDTDADGRPDAILADAKIIKAYPIRQGDAKWIATCSHKQRGTKTRILSVEAADLNGDGRSEIYATVHDGFFKRIETHVLACEGGAMKTLQTIPGTVRSYKKADGTWGLATQQLLADRTFPYGGIFVLEYKDGKFGPSKQRIKNKRLQWVHGFGISKRRDKEILVFYDRRQRIRLIFDKGKWSTPDTYGQTRERVSWHDNKLMFHARPIVETGDDDLKGVYSIRNIPALYGMARSMGLYKGSELYYLRWNGVGLEPAWKASIGGYAAGLAEFVPGAGQSARLAVPVNGAHGSTSVWLYDK